MKTSLKFTDIFLILISALINTIALITVPFNHDSIGMVALIQLFIGAYTMFISAPIWLVQINSNSGAYKKRIFHFFSSLIYLAFLIIVLPQFHTSDFTKALFIIIVPQILLYFYCSFYLIEMPFFKTFKTKIS